MPDSPTIDAKLYQLTEDRTLSMADLLEYFEQKGTMRVSDLHLKVGCPPVYRYDGRLQKLKGPPLDAETVEAFARCLFHGLNVEQLRKAGSLDGSWRHGTIQFRLNCFADNDGLALAVRALDNEPPPLEKIGFPNLVWQDIVNAQHGLVLITGITGAGKSTTIASLINHIIAKRACRIITLEDPIEYRLRSRSSIVSQREIGRDVPDYARGLRDCLREDPDVIFVGEMRDRDSTRWTLSAAETGHLVFSTLHTRDVRGTVTRILDMFPANQQDEVANQLSLGLLYVLSQKLLPRANGEGRVVAMEVLNNTYATSNLIRLAKVEQIYSQLQTKVRDLPSERMVTMEASLAQLAAEGEVDPEIAEQFANHPGEFLSALRHLQG